MATLVTGGRASGLNIRANNDSGHLANLNSPPPPLIEMSADQPQQLIETKIHGYRGLNKKKKKIWVIEGVLFRILYKNKIFINK